MPIPSLLNFVTEILDIGLKNINIISTGGRCYQFNNVKVTIKRIVILKGKDFIGWRIIILVYELRMVEWK